MKKFFNSLMILAAAAATFVSCSKEVDTQDESPVSGKMKTITVKTSIDTRTTLDSGHENIVWSAGDVMKIFNNADTTSFRAPYVAGADLEVQVPAATTEIYAHYPYYKGNKTGPTDVSVYITNTQKQTNPGELNGYNYPMVAKGTVSADNKALITLYPVASALALNIYHTGLDGDEYVNSVTVTPTSNTDFIGSQKTNLTGDSIKYTSAASSEPITVTLTNSLSLGNTKPTNVQTFAGQIYVCLAKQSYANVKFEILTNKGKYTITSNNSPFDCVNNDFVPVNINLAKATFEAAEELSGTYVILAKQDEVYFAMANTHVDNSNRLDEVEFSEGATTTDNRAIVWTIAKSGDNYSITDVAGKYLTASSSNNANVNSSAAYCSILENSDGTYAITQAVSGTDRYLSRNNSDKGFAFYTSSMNRKLYLVPIALQALPILEWGAESIYIEADDNDSHEIALTATDATSVSLAVFEEDEETVATWLVASYTNGKVTYQADANTSALRHAVIIATATNAYGSVTAKINVTQKADNSHITKGDAWSYTFTNNPFNNKTATLSDGDFALTWTASVDPDYTNGALSFGTNKNPAAATMTTSSYEDGISSIVIAIQCNSGKAVTAAISVGGEALECDGNTSVTHTGNTLTEYEFSSTNLVSGAIVIAFTDPTGGYQIKSIDINPEPPAPATVTGISVEDYTATFTASESGSYNFDGKVYAVYSDNSKVEVASGGYTVTGTVDLTTAGTYTLTVSATIDGTNYSKEIEITVNAAGVTEQTLFLETFGSTTSNTGYGSYTGYSATSAMFSTSGNVNTHYSGSGSVGKNNLSAANLSSGYDGASGLSGCYHGGTANTTATILQISDINIQGATNISVSFGALGGSASHKMDVYYKIDGGSETALITNGSITNANWTLLSAEINGTGQSLTLIFKHTPTKAWTIRMDDIKVIGTK